MTQRFGAPEFDGVRLPEKGYSVGWKSSSSDARKIVVHRWVCVRLITADTCKEIGRKFKRLIGRR